MSRCTFVWAHGLTSSMAQEDELGLFDWSAVDGGGARVVRYDARGHGTAEPSQLDHRSYRWCTLVDDMLRHAGTGPFVAGGTSMGAATALYAALRAPRRIQGLVLATPPRAWEHAQERALSLESDAAVVERSGLPGYVDLVKAAPQPAIFSDEFPGARDVELRHLATMNEKVLPAVLRGAARSDLPSPEEVRSIVVPTLILAWPGDPAHPVPVAERLSELLVLSEVHVASSLADVRMWPKLVDEFLSGICQWE